MSGFMHIVEIYTYRAKRVRPTRRGVRNPKSAYIVSLIHSMYYLKYIASLPIHFLLHPASSQ
jgi:hypothetical protein